MNRHLYMVLISLVVPLSLFANDLASWRPPTTDELGPYSEWRNKDPNRYLLVRADFDGDGKDDTARLVVNEKENKIGLSVILSTLGKVSPLLIETNNDKRAIESRGIKVAKPGKYETACGKGYYDCKKGEPKHIQLDHPGIDFFKYESANMYFIWNSTKKTFDEIGISD